MRGLIAEGAGQTPALIIISGIAIWFAVNLVGDARRKAQWQAKETSGENSRERAERRQKWEVSSKHAFQANLELSPTDDPNGRLQYASTLYVKHLGVGLHGVMTTVVPSMDWSNFSEWRVQQGENLSWAAQLVGSRVCDLAEGVATAALAEYRAELADDRAELAQISNFHSFATRSKEQRTTKAWSWASRSAFISVYGSAAVRSECTGLGLELASLPRQG